jgi:hypothetical protein
MLANKDYIMDDRYVEYERASGSSGPIITGRREMGTSVFLYITQGEPF